MRFSWIWRGCRSWIQRKINSICDHLFHREMVSFLKPFPMKTIAVLLLCLAVVPALAVVVVQPVGTEHSMQEETASLAMLSSVIGVSAMIAGTLLFLFLDALFLPCLLFIGLGFAASIVGLELGSSRLKKYFQTLSQTAIRKFRTAKIFGWIGVGLGVAWAAFLVLMAYVLIFVLGLG